jgi:hypothetical protein
LLPSPRQTFAAALLVEISSLLFLFQKSSLKNHKLCVATRWTTLYESHKKQAKTRRAARKEGGKALSCLMIFKQFHFILFFLLASEKNLSWQVALVTHLDCVISSIHVGFKIHFTVSCEESKRCPLIYSSSAHPSETWKKFLTRKSSWN